MANPKLLVVTFGSVLSLGSCNDYPQQVYERANLPRSGAVTDGVAVIKQLPGNSESPPDKEVFIESVDGRKSSPGVRSVAVMPGAHEVIVTCVWRRGSKLERLFSTGRGMAGLSVTVKAGRTYQLDNFTTLKTCSPGVYETQ